MSSMTYWNVAGNVRDRIATLHGVAEEMYVALESNDDPGEVAEFLGGIEKDLLALALDISPNVAALKKIAKAMSEVPGVTS